MERSFPTPFLNEAAFTGAVTNSCSRSDEHKPPEETIKTRSVLILVVLAIGLALPSFAQQKNTPDPRLREKLIAAIKKHTDALDKNDAAAVAANFTEDGILVTPDGPIFGRESMTRI